ncbi:MAG: GNAT family N-acetyltransferase [Ignavibacteria bacterium]|nr:GNAT family N-acetyltransferase [Ignavibacteria bacterium]
MNNISIRKAILSDSEKIINFNKAMALETENLVLKDNTISQGVVSVLNNLEYGFYIVAESDGIIVGSLMITYEWSDWRNGLIWWFQSVYIEMPFRRAGLFSAMYDFVKTMAEKESAVKGLRLYVEKNNVIAQMTYSKLGMEETYYKLYEAIF